jgi:hypothetical protein
MTEQQHKHQHVAVALATHYVDTLRIYGVLADGTARESYQHMIYTITGRRKSYSSSSSNTAAASSRAIRYTVNVMIVVSNARSYLALLERREPLIAAHRCL